MPTLKHTISDDEHAAYKRAAALAFMPVSVWMRSNLGRLAQEAAPKVAPAKEAPRWSKSDIKSFDRSLANCAEMEMTISDYLTYNRAHPLSDKTLPYMDSFEAWARAQGHLD